MTERDDMPGERAATPQRQAAGPSAPAGRAGGAVSTATDDRLNDDLEPMPPPSRRRPRWLLLTVLVVMASVAILAGLFAYVRSDINPGGHPGADVAVNVPSHSSTKQIASLLSSKHVIRGSRVFAYWTKIEGKGPYLAGDYVLKKNSKYDDVATVLAAGPAQTSDRFVVPEGLTLRQIADRVGKLPGRNADTFYKLATAGVVRSPVEPADVKTLEGLLFPSTYFVGPKDGEPQILQRMIDGFVQVAQKVNLTPGASLLHLAPYQVVIVASMIEREAKFDADRAKIAEVIYNRLAKGMPLGFNSTVAYGLNKTSLDAGDIKVAGPYNTYLDKGLPPTPIASPGASSLQAAVTPEAGTLLYFAAIDKAGHVAFATTIADHNKNVALSRANGVAP